ncbi:hypothetical protein FQA39_LY16465 [Lamprigera yunnana]|nr:hypothetical protein FQA39_LY16465 [Lamprigera yunnana]
MVNMLPLILFSLLVSRFLEANSGVLNSILPSNEEFIHKIKHVLITGDLNISSECSLQFSKYVYNLEQDKYWALKMFDANTNLKSQILRGKTNDFLNSFKECVDIDETTTTNILQGKYCTARNNHSNLGNLSAGICFPNNCSAFDIVHIYKSVDIDLQTSENECQIKENRIFDTLAIISIAFFLFILGIVVTSTLYELILIFGKKRSKHRLLTAFSLITNGNNLFATTTCENAKGDQILCINGLRAISAIWIVLYHSSRIKWIVLKQPLNTETWIEAFFIQMWHSSTFAVDTFFVIGGLLVSYNEMKAISRQQNFNIIRHYIGRYLRITPVLLTIVVFHLSLINYMGSGPLWNQIIQDGLSRACRNNWWRTLLYINNYKQFGGTCVKESWYLAVDMQLFVSSPLLLIPLRKIPKLTLTFSLLLAIVIITYSFVTVYIYGIPSESYYANEYYLKTHIRATPWLFGIILGYLVSTSKDITIAKVTSRILTVVSLVVFAIDIIFTPDTISPGPPYQIENAFLIAFSRPLWCVAVCWIIYASTNGYLKCVNRFMSLRIFQLLSKITYSLYLCHLSLILIVTCGSNYYFNFTLLHHFAESFGYVIIAMCVAIVLTLSVELPCTTIVKFVLNKSRRPVES